VTVGDLVWNDTNANGIQDSGELGVDGVTVELFRSVDDSLVGTVTTAGGGLYSFTTVPGSYYLKFSGLTSGFVFTSSTASAASDAGDSDATAGTGRTDVIALAPGANDANWDAGIYQPVTVGDLVWNDTNANGIQDSGEVGVDGVTVELFRSVDDSLVGTVTTAGGGLYSFTTVPGSYYLKFSGLTSGFVFTSSTASAASDAGDSDATAGTGRTDVIALAPGANDANWDAGIYQPVTVGDLVWNDANANGVQDSGEVGVDGVTVELFRSVDDSLVGTVTTAGGGLYSFTTVPGSYYLKFSGLTSGFVFTSSTASAASDAGDSDATAGTGRTDVIALAPGANDANWDAGIYQPVTVGDLVWNDTNANGIQDSGEVGVDGVTVELFRSVDDSLVGTVTTAGGGLYSFTTVPGSYYLKFSGLTSGFVFTSSTASAASDAGDSDAIAGTGRTDVIALAPGANDANWDAGIYQPVTVGDLVWNDTNANGIQDSGEVGVDGVTVELFRSVDDSLVGTVTTAGGGLYSFTTVPGSYYLKFSGLTSGFVFTSSTASAASDAGDSDAIAGTGRTDVIALAPGANDTNWDAGIYQPAAVGNLVWDDANANGIQDSGELGVDGLTVELFNSADDTLIGSTTTAGGGIYSLTAAPGSYYLKFGVLPSGFVFSHSTPSSTSDSHDSDANPASGKTDVIVLAAGANDPNWDAGIYQPATVGDLVWNDANADGIQDSGELGVDGVTVELFRSADDALIGTGTTAGGGLYSFTTVPGSYYLKFGGLPSGYSFGPSTASVVSDSGDSDVNPATGKTDAILLAPGANDPNWDAGIYQTAKVGDWVWNDANANGLQDDGEAGFDGVTVELYRGADDTLAGTTTTADGGHYAFNVVAGTYYVKFGGIPSGFVLSSSSPAAVSDVGDSDADPLTGRTDLVVLEAGANDLNWDAGIYQPATVGDLVWNDVNANGTQDDGEIGVDGVIVELYRSTDDTLVGTTTTADGGLYSLQAGPGSYYLKFSGMPTGYVFVPSTESTDSDPSDSDVAPGTGRTDVFTLVAGSTNDTWDAGVFQPTIIGDWVWNDINANGVQDGDELSVDGVTVELFRAADDVLIGTTATSGGGLYGFAVPEGSYYVRFSSLPSGYAFSPSISGGGSDALDSDADPATGRTESMFFAAGVSDPTWDAGIYRPATIGDRVWNDANMNGVQDSGEAGVDGVTVELYRAADDSLAGTTTTSGGGQFSFVVLPTDYYLRFTQLPADFVFSQSTTSAASDPDDSDADPGTGRTDRTTLVAGETDLTWDAGVYALANVGGIVWNDADANGGRDGGESGIDGVAVELFKAGDSSLAGTATTANGGRYQFTVQPGEYYVKFAAPPEGYVRSPSTPSAAPDSNDSDADVAGGLTTATTLASGETDLTWDAGLYQPATLGDWVWDDINGDGVQDSGEPGVDGITVELRRSSDGALQGTAITSGGGFYSFTTTPGTYYATFSGLPANYVFTTSTPGGSSDPTDSDVHAGTGRTDDTALVAGESDPSWDAGIYLAPEPDCVPVTVNFSGSSAMDGTDGNVRTFSAGGVSVKATAFSRIKNGGSWSPAYLGLFSGGLGVTDSGEADGSSNRHVTDNLDRDNYILLEFSQPVILDRAYLGYVISDSDLSVWVGTFADPYNNHLTLSDAVLGSFAHSEVNLASGSGVRWADLNAGSVVGNAVVIAAWMGETDPDDQFKLATLELCQPVTALAQIGDRVWNDANMDGVQDANEAGIDGVTVELHYASDSAVVATTTTAGGGLYNFAVPPGDYYVRFAGLPTGFVFSPSTPSPASDSTDSDADETTGVTDVFALSADEVETSWDAGIFQPAAPECTPSTMTFSGSSSTDGTDGNIRSFSADGVSVRVSAFSRTKSAGTWATGFLGVYSGGAWGDRLQRGRRQQQSACRRQPRSRQLRVVRVLPAGGVESHLPGLRDHRQRSAGVGRQLRGSLQQPFEPERLGSWGICPHGNELCFQRVHTMGRCERGRDHRERRGDRGQAGRHVRGRPLQDRGSGYLPERWIDAFGHRFHRRQRDPRLQRRWRLSGEVGLSGFTVQLKNSSGTVLQTTTTSSTGAYSFADLSAATYTVVVTPLASYQLTEDPDSTFDGKSPVSLALGQAKTGVNFGFTGTAPGVALVKTGPSTAMPGQTITLRYEVSNTGNTCLYGGMSVCDPLFGGEIWHQTPVVPGASYVIEKVYTVKSSDSNPLTSTATAYGHPPGSLPVVSASSTWSVAIVGGAPTSLTAQAGNNQVSLSWNASPGASSYKVKRSTGSCGSYTVIQSGVTTTSFVDSTAANGTAYFYVVSAVVNGVETLNSNEASAIPSSGLPSPWNSTDIGWVSIGGGASHASGNFTANGSGEDIWNTEDGFQFVYQTASGNCSVVARVTGVDSTHPWAKAGVMIRETLSSGSKHASVFITPENGAAFQYRKSTRRTSYNENVSGPTAPYWVKIVRNSSTFTAYRSSNGSSWSQIGSVSISMGSSVYIGLAVTSHDNGMVCGATFNSVTATP
jgi:hypothetical protein